MNMNSKQYIKTVYLLLSLSVQYEYEIKTVYEIENSISYYPYLYNMNSNQYIK